MLVGYAKNSGTYSPDACWGVVPDVPIYMAAADNPQSGMIKVGTIVYTDSACTTPLNGNWQYWSFSKTGGAADRAISVGGDGTILNHNFRNGVLFGYVKADGTCSTTSFDIPVYNGADDVQEWYVGKAVDKTTSNYGGIFLAAGSYALSYSSSGPAIGTATFGQVINLQNTYTSMASCVVPARCEMYVWD